MQPGDFLKLLWPIALDGAACIWFRQSGSTIHVPLPALHGDWAEEDDYEVLGVQMDTYTSPGLRCVGLESDQAGRKLHVIALAGFVIDIDMAHGVHRANAKSKKPLPSSIDDVDSILSAGPEPTVIVDSGGGIQPWYLFPEPWRLADSAMRTAAGHAYKSFYQPFLDRATELGFHLDKGIASIQHLFRLPGTKNYKFDDPKTIEVVCQSASRIPIPAVRVVAGRKTESSKPASTPTLTDDALEKVRQWMRKLRPDHPHKQAIADVLAGRSFAEPGSRNDTMYQVCSTIAWLTPARELEIENLVELLRPSLAVWAAEPDAEKSLDEELEVAAGMFESAIENRAEKDAARNQVLAGIARGMSRVIGRREQKSQKPSGAAGAGSSVDHEGSTPSGSTKTESRAESNGDDGADADSDDEDELEQILKASIVQYRSNYFAYRFRDARYQGPYTKEEFLTQLKGDWENADEAFALEYENDKGELKDKTLVRVLKEYATGAKKLIGHIDLDQSYFDIERLTFHDAKCPPRVTEARFDPAIDEWLRLLGGEKADQLLNWVATAFENDRQSPALYLEGPPSVGKNLLADGLSRRFRESGPAQFTAIIENNSDMFACPMILLDEGLPRKASQTSAFIRNLIASSEHTFREKYIVNHKVQGCVRLMIAANNDRVLAQLANEDLSEVDIDAITDRFLHIKTDEAAAEWIREVNKIDRSIIDRWKTDDLMAKHALWLYQNRFVPQGRRFRIDGEAEEIARALIVRGDKQEMVLEWLARFVLMPKLLVDFYKQNKKQPLAMVGNGQLLVNVQAILDCSEKYRPGIKDRLGPTTIGRVLKQLSHKTRRLGERGERTKYHLVNYENVKKIAETLQLDTASMYANITADADFSPLPGPRVPKLTLVPMPEGDA